MSSPKRLLKDIREIFLDLAKAFNKKEKRDKNRYEIMKAKLDKIIDNQEKLHVKLNSKLVREPLKVESDFPSFEKWVKKNHLTDTVSKEILYEKYLKDNNLQDRDG